MFDFSPFSEAVISAGAVLGALAIIGGVVWKTLRVINRLAGVIGEDDEGRTIMGRMDEADERLEFLEEELRRFEEEHWTERVVTLESEVKSIWRHVGSKDV